MRKSPSQRRFWKTVSRPPASSRRRASPASGATGLSTTTASPRSRPASATSTCELFGVATTSTSMPSSRRLEVRRDAHAGMGGARLLGALRRARHDGAQLEPVDGGDERRVEDPAGEPEAGDADPQAHPQDPSIIGR